MVDVRQVSSRGCDNSRVTRQIDGGNSLAMQQLLRASRDQPWSDVGEIDWGKVKETGFLSPAEHCDYRFLAQVEGRSRPQSQSEYT
jgi:hypothetical protein